MSEISFIFIDEEIPILKHFCRYGQKSSQIFLINSSLKSTSSAYSVSRGRPISVIGGLGLFIEVMILLRRSRKAPAKTSVNKKPDKRSPQNAPKKHWNSAEKEPFTLTLGLVLDSKSLTKRISSSSQPHSTRRSRMVERRIVLNALDMSIPILWYSHLFRWTTDNITRWHHTMSAHDLPCLYAHCHGPVNTLTLASILFQVAIERIFLTELERVEKEKK